MNKHARAQSKFLEYFFECVVVQVFGRRYETLVPQDDDDFFSSNFLACVSGRRKKRERGGCFFQLFLSSTRISESFIDVGFSPLIASREATLRVPRRSFPPSFQLGLCLSSSHERKEGGSPFDWPFVFILSLAHWAKTGAARQPAWIEAV